MGDMLADAFALLTTELRDHASSPVVYERKANRKTTNRISLDATIAEQERNVAEGEGHTKIERAGIEIFFPAIQFNFGDGQAEPAAGDIVEVTTGSVVRRYRVSPPEGGGAAWDYSDKVGQTQMVVRAKYIGMG